MEEFSIKLLSDIYKKIDVKEIKFHQLQFPFELQEALIRMKEDNVD